MGAVGPTGRLNTAIFSHGHIDHVFGVGVFEEEASSQRWPGPTVVAHEAMPARFDRYVLTGGYNAVINQRQFGMPELTWPTEYRYPDRTYRDHLELEVGGRRFELHHARGETDDHTWTWVPDRQILCTGDLFIWATPNAGNPQKVQRYPLEWAAALRAMSELGAAILLPGHGVPVVGHDRVLEALTTTAELLESIVAQTLALMNAGAPLNDVIHAVEMPADLLARPYLRPVYDDPEFIVRNLWRQYGGWYDGDPASLKPARAHELATELAGLAGGRPAWRSEPRPSSPPAPAAICDWPATWLSSPPWPHRPTPASTACGGGLRRPRRHRDLDDGEGHLRLGGGRIPPPPPLRGLPPS